MHKAVIGGKEYRVESGLEGSKINGELMDADIIEIRQGRFHIICGHRSYSAEIVHVDLTAKMISVKVNQNTYQVAVKDKFDELLHDLGLDAVNLRQAGDVKAPMPGLVLNIMVKPGQKILKGDAIIVLEAMKMENILKAAADGEVKKINVKKGDKVEKNQVMVNLV